MKNRSERISSSITLHTPVHSRPKHDYHAPYDWKLEQDTPEAVVIDFCAAYKKSTEKKSEDLLHGTSDSILPAEFIPPSEEQLTQSEDTTITNKYVDQLLGPRLYVAIGTTIMTGLLFSGGGLRNAAVGISNPYQAIEAISSLI